MKRLALRFLILAVGLLCLPSIAAADKTETTDTVQTSADGNTAGSTQTGGIPINSPPAEETPADTAKSIETASSAAGTDGTDSKSGEAASSTAGADGKEAESGKPPDLTFASIHSKGLTVAEGNKWYYESFDRQGRSSFAVLYEDGTAVEKTEWAYNGTTRYPVQKKVLRAAGSETFRYDEAGRELSVERYEGKTLTSKTENVYNGGGKLIEQTITAGKNTDRSVWEFAGDKAVAQTKYRNGKKTSFIELTNTPHIIHLYVDDKEVYVGEEQ